MSLGFKITLHWVKAHDGHELNEEVDWLAKFGTVSSWRFEVPTAWSFIKSSLKNISLRKWYHRWNKEKTCRQTRLILPCFYPQLSKSLWNLDRHNLSRMVQFITGHNYLRYHLKIMSKSDTDLCRQCGESSETAWHLLTECPALAMTRLMNFFEEESFSLPIPEKFHRMILYSIIHTLLDHPETFSRESSHPGSPTLDQTPLPS